MKEQVLITINGVQVTEDEAQSVPELITVGTYRLEDGVHQVTYEEQLGDTDEVTISRLYFVNDRVELKREGGIETHMVFEKDKKSLTFYETPYGSVEMEMTSHEVNVCTEAENIDIHLEYDIAMNEQFVGECSLNIHIQKANNA